MQHKTQFSFFAKTRPSLLLRYSSCCIHNAAGPYTAPTTSDTNIADRCSNVPIGPAVTNSQTDWGYDNLGYRDTVGVFRNWSPAWQELLYRAPATRSKEFEGQRPAAFYPPAFPCLSALRCWFGLAPSESTRAQAETGGWVLGPKADSPQAKHPDAPVIRSAKPPPDPKSGNNAVGGLGGIGPVSGAGEQKKKRWGTRSPHVLRILNLILLDTPLRTYPAITQP